MPSYLPRIGLLGASGATGGWVLEKALERGHEIRVLTRSPSLLMGYASKVTVVNGSPKSMMKKFIYDAKGELLVDVVVGVRVEGESVMEETAEALVSTLRNQKVTPRIVWMTAIPPRDDDDEEEPVATAHQQPPCFELLPNKALFGKLQLDCFFPFLKASKDSLTDMKLSEAVLLRDAAIQAKTVLVRPTKMPSVHATTFSPEWREAESDSDHFYQFVRDGDKVPAYAIDTCVYRLAVATAVLDLAFDENRDGTTVGVYKRVRSIAPITPEQVDL